MNFVKFNTADERQGILTIKGDTITCINDNDIRGGDCLLHMLYSKVVNDGVRTFVVDEVLEERPSRGQWNNSKPALWRKLKCKVQTIPTTVMKDAGHLKVEEKMENGKKIQVATLI